MRSDLVPVLHIYENWIPFFTCGDLITVFHRCEDLVPIYRTCKDLVVIFHICEKCCTDSTYLRKIVPVIHIKCV